MKKRAREELAPTPAVVEHSAQPVRPPVAFRRRLSSKVAGGDVDTPAGTLSSSSALARIDLTMEIDSFQAQFASAGSQERSNSSKVAVARSVPRHPRHGPILVERQVPMPARSTSARALGGRAIAPAIRDDDADGGDQIERVGREADDPNVVDERWFLGMESKIVGVQHYGGVVSDRESVVLRRQPNNAYDCNAIQVLNVRNEQIGHLPREMAAVLAPVMDLQRGADSTEEVRFEGYIPRGSNNVFSMPLRLAAFGRDPLGRLAPRMRELGDSLRRTFCAAARSTVQVQTSQLPQGTLVNEIDEQTWSWISGNRSSPKKSAPKGISMQEVLERELEGIFRSGVRYEDAIEAESPLSLSTTLFPHQKKALHWMMQRERALTVDEALLEEGALPVASGKRPSRSQGSQSSVANSAQFFFWSKTVAPDGRVLYKNLATNSAFREPPLLPQAGILADDMGLGKTLTLLALISASACKTLHRVAGKLSADSTLIVCPLSVLFNWSEQIRLHAPRLRVRVYHGPDRDRDARSFTLHDVIVTTYDTVRADCKHAGGGLKSVNWRRVVLDEAHVIKSHRTATSKAVCELTSQLRWCLTGTPIQNSVEDLFALARFLKLAPFDQFEWFNRAILRPLKSADAVGLERLQVLLRTWCLRRTKEMQIVDNNTGVVRPLLLLPPKTLQIVKVPLEPSERILYDKLFKCAGERVRQLTQDTDLGKHFSQVLVLLMRLRQLCCSSGLLPSDLLVELRSVDSDETRVIKAAVAALGTHRVEELMQNLAAAQEDDCSICILAGCDVVTRCGHVFHRNCLEDVLRSLGSGGVGACPLCRQVVKRSELLEKPEGLQLSEEAESIAAGTAASPIVAESDKIGAVVRFVLNDIVDSTDGLMGKPHKVVVFSQFTKVLDLVQVQLAKAGVALTRLDGTLQHERRVEALQTFRDHAHVQVILCSLKAAGTGINLTVANHVVLIDPWWNPAVEDQAIDRAHRLGQQRPVRVLRFVAEGTVEERILEVHKQKRELMDGALKSLSRAELRSLRLSTVASLFDPVVERQERNL